MKVSQVFSTKTNCQIASKQEEEQDDFCNVYYSI